MGPPRASDAVLWSSSRRHAACNAQACRGRVDAGHVDVGQGNEHDVLARVDCNAVLEALRDEGWIDRRVLGAESRAVTDSVCRIEVRYDIPCRRLDGRNPDEVIVKLPSRYEHGAWAEAEAYGRLAGLPSVAAPRSLLLRDAQGQPSALVLSDAGYGLGGTLDNRAARASVDRLARMHARYRAAVPAGFGLAPQIVVPSGWAGALPVTDSEHRDLLEDAERALHKCPPLPTPEHLTLVHGDLVDGHVLSGSGGATFVGWARAHAGNGALDLAALVRGATEDSVSRHREDELLARYHTGLVRGGVSNYSLAECWAEFEVARADALRRLVAAWYVDRRPSRAGAIVRSARGLLDRHHAVAAAA